jgi:hypothetical protein
MARIRLFRGISVTPEESEPLRLDILSNGLHSPGKLFHLVIQDFGVTITELMQREDLSTDLTRPARWIKTKTGGYSEPIGGSDAICACGDLLGASYYAIEHFADEAKTEPIVVEFEVDTDDVVVDGRDLVYNVGFQSAGNAYVRHALCQVYGEKLGVYLDKAWEKSEQNYRIAIGDLAMHDSDVILAHLKNNLTIGGRANTRFCSAFMVKLPVPPEQIIGFVDPIKPPIEADIRLEALWSSLGH